MSDFVHLHVHSEYSLLDGLIKIPQLLDKVEANGMKAVALTDHGVMYGSYKFYREATERGIKPILGVEVYHAKNSLHDRPKGNERDSYHLVLLAKNEKGYKNLLKLTTIAHLQGYHYKPRIDLQLLEQHAAGLICLSGCLHSLLAQLILADAMQEATSLVERFSNIFPEKSFYLELQHHPKLVELDKVNRKLVEFSRSFGLPLVATNDVHYLAPEDAEAHEILLCVQTGHTILDKNRPLSMIDSPDFYFRSSEEMSNFFLEYPEAIENTSKIANLCELKLQEGKLILPPFQVPGNNSPADCLKTQSNQNLQQFYPHPPEEIRQRLDYELEVIINKGYATYFLIVADFVSWAKQNGIAVGPGRGSVAGSLVAYVLGITQVNPIEHELPFERFLNPARPSPPDIDLDFADDRRDEVIDYVTHKYGEDKVAQIITFGTMEARQAIRDVGRALGMPYSQPDRIAKMVPPGYQGFPMTIERAIEESNELRMAHNVENDTRRLLDLAKKLEGIARHASVHAAGVVIADKNLTEYTPIQKETRGGKVVTQYDMYCLDINAAPDGRAIGLLKMDFLGLRNLTILQNAIEYVRQQQSINIDINAIPLDERDVYQTLATGETTGIFQMESRGMRQLARKLKPTKFSDIAAMVALYRPGPMNWIDDFIAAKESPAKIVYPHKDLQPILAETYGIAVYQEQCMQIAHKMAGYQMAEADRLRYAIGKKKKVAMRKEKVKFIKGCVANGYAEKTAEKVWSLIEKFVGYGFNKAHSASYALIAYHTAYMKTKFPIEFMTAVLSAESRVSAGPARDQKMAQVIEECRRMKVPVLPPEINRSQADFTIKDNAIRFGLSAIKHVGSTAIEAILTARGAGGDFISLSDFCKRVNLSKVNRKTIESLIKAGAFSGFGKRAVMLTQLPEVMKQTARIKQQIASGQVSMFDGGEDVDSATLSDNFADVQEFTREEIFAFEKELLGLYLREHPLTGYEEKIKSAATHFIHELSSDLLNRKIIVGGMISNIKRVTTRKDNREMAFLRIEDRTGSIETVVFPSVYERHKNMLVTDRIILIQGSVSEREDRIHIIVDKIKSMG